MVVDFFAISLVAKQNKSLENNFSFNINVFEVD